jgi:hypothetical protein
MLPKYLKEKDVCTSKIFSVVNVRDRQNIWFAVLEEEYSGGY